MAWLGDRNNVTHPGLPHLQKWKYKRFKATQNKRTSYTFYVGIYSTQWDSVETHTASPDFSS